MEFVSIKFLIDNMETILKAGKESKNHVSGTSWKLCSSSLIPKNTFQNIFWKDKHKIVLNGKAK